MHLTWPIPPAPGSQEPNLGQPFGGHEADYSKLGMIGHNGQDMPYPLGTPVYAAHDGYIIYVNDTDRAQGFGVSQYFEEDGQGYELEYWHFENCAFPGRPYNFADRSTFVKQGTLLGHVDTTGFSTGNHLHFEVRLVDPKTLTVQNFDNGYKGGVDPLPYLRNKDTKSMHLAKDNGTVYIVSGVNQKTKLGVADPVTLALFGDEPIVEEDTSAIPETYTVAQGFIFNKK